MRVGHPFRRHSALGVLLASSVLSACGAKSTTPGTDRVGDASASEPTSARAGSRSVNANPGGLDAGTGVATGEPAGAGVDPGNGTGPGIAAFDGVDAGPSTSALPADDGVEAGTSSGASAPSGDDADAGFGTGVGVPAGPMDAGLVEGSQGSDAGGSPRPCEEDAVRCSLESGQREVCEAGAWVEQDFVCATSVRVNATEGIPCAVKADGSFICWWGRTQYQLRDYTMPEVSGALHSLEHVVYSAPDSARTAVLTRDGTLVDPLGNQTEDVVQFEPSRYDVCWVTEDGSAACSEFGPLTSSPAMQVAIDMQRRCALLRDGSVVCHIDGTGPVTLTGHYTDIDIGSNILCGIELGGGVTCTDLQDDTLTPWSRLEGTYTRLAVNDLGVCAMLESGKLECVSVRDVPQPMDSYEYQPTGTYTDLDAGDWTVCAIRIDGSIECWQTRTFSPEMWVIPEGW